LETKFFQKFSFVIPGLSCPEYSKIAIKYDKYSDVHFRLRDTFDTSYCLSSNTESYTGKRTDFFQNCPAIFCSVVIIKEIVLWLHLEVSQNEFVILINLGSNRIINHIRSNNSPKLNYRVRRPSSEGVDLECIFGYVLFLLYSIITTK